MTKKKIDFLNIDSDHTTAGYPYSAAIGAGGVAESHQPNYIACVVTFTHLFKRTWAGILSNVIISDRSDF
jgi:hypothetical protein